MNRALVALLLGPVLGAWSPLFHEVQTKLASRMVPAPMAALLHTQRHVLLQAGRGMASDEPPTVEQVEAQFQRIVALSEAGISARNLARELGTLAHLAQVLSDPGATVGVTALRAEFTGYADQNLGKMVLTRAPVWAVDAPSDPRPWILALSREKWERHRLLLEHFDPERGTRVGTWDDLSVPFAQAQLAFNDGVHATANLWILLWRAVGDRWPVLPEPGLGR